MRLWTAAAAVALSFAAPAAFADEIHLVCSGESSRAMTDYVANVSGSNGSGGFINGSAMGAHRERQSDEVYVDIADGRGRIKLPKTLVPLISGGGDDGWREFKSLDVGADAINGEVSLNLINHPKISISRVTGRIDISELKRSFAGQCQPYDPKTVVRKF
jgi:hypothetical protein